MLNPFHPVSPVETGGSCLPPLGPGGQRMFHHGFVQPLLGSTLVICGTQSRVGFSIPPMAGVGTKQIVSNLASAGVI